ncbi:Glyoxylate/hydroxypyruvate reductase [Actinidia chinensis var. chinensis]|uniref:Glyoxylate/hydroxypyruvate reductase n=1 Tax=Actinidia chinensis var. chinensis TaxID=1590841 RepID=A0A2R6QSA6_ACTCC|nr:Glyoxylate/hydroxypyruvate reductase [Actinidia chinensis var. chinensis]
MENQEVAAKLLPKVLILEPPGVFTAFETEFSQKFECLRAWESPIPTDEFLDAHARSVEAMLVSGFTPITSSVLHRVPSLRCIVTTSVGLDHMDLQECRRREIAVANAGNVFSEDVADLAVALLIDVLRRITAADRFVRGEIWPIKGEYPLGSKLGGKRVGIVGLGSIGLDVAKRLEAFGCILSYNSRKKKPSVPFPFYSNACELAANCEVLVICCALTEETHHMINYEVLSALGKEGVVVNIARGGIIDEKELVRCLVQGDIAGAGLDVFENEPEVPRELFGLANVVLSPHRAVFTEESFRDAFELILGNFEAFFSNKPLLSPVMDV